MARSTTGRRSQTRMHAAAWQSETFAGTGGLAGATSEHAQKKRLRWSWVDGASNTWLEVYCPAYEDGLRDTRTAIPRAAADLSIG